MPNEDATCEDPANEPPQRVVAAFSFETGDGYRLEVEAVGGGPTFLLIVDLRGNQVQAALSPAQAQWLGQGLVWLGGTTGHLVTSAGRSTRP